MTKSEKTKGERIAKVLARAGVGSRRDVEAMISDRRITVDGAVIETPATFLGSLDGVCVDGHPVKAAEEPVLYRFHKPRGLITTHKDPQGRRTVFDQLPKSLGRMISVGRLDLNSEGLLLLTNDGALAHLLENPESGLTRIYRVRAFGKTSESQLESLKEGCEVDGVRYGPVHARFEGGTKTKTSGLNRWLTVKLEEGKNREVRKVLAHIGLEVNRLIRTAYGPFSLGSLPREGLAIIPSPKIEAVRRQINGEEAEKDTKGAREGWAKPKAKQKKKPPTGRGRKQKRNEPDHAQAKRKKGTLKTKPKAKVKGKAGG